ncbi:MAG: SprT-like domain-containing protein [Verrucomicrobiales bacterium]
MAHQLELFDDDDEPASKRAEEPRIPQHSPVAEPARVRPGAGLDPELTQTAAQHAERLELGSLARRLSVAWNPRMRTAAGRAFTQTASIELNSKLQELPEAHREAEIQNTFLHELAHLVAYARAGRRRIAPHGPEWQTACRDLGIPGESRCHSLDFQPRRMRRKFAYQCPHCAAVIQRVRKLKRRVACYDCCREHNRGRFDRRFALVERKLT